MDERGFVAGANCPECGSDLAPGRPACGTCGFELVGAPRRELGRARPLAAGLAVLLMTIGVVLVVTHENEPEAPRALAAARAERLLEGRLSSLGDDDTAAVTCRAPVEAGPATRCRVRYSGGGVQAIRVRLTARGELDIDIP